MAEEESEAFKVQTNALTIETEVLILVHHVDVGM